MGRWSSHNAGREGGRAQRVGLLPRVNTAGLDADHRVVRVPHRRAYRRRRVARSPCAARLHSAARARRLDPPDADSRDEHCPRVRLQCARFTKQYE